MSNKKDFNSPFKGSLEGFLNDFYTTQESLDSIERLKKELDAEFRVPGQTPQKPAGKKPESPAPAKPSAENAAAKPEAAKTAASEAQEKRAEPEPTLEELLAELDSLVGLTKVKEDVKSLLNFIKVNKMRQERDMKVPTMSYHLVFTGNPGTGKTTVARLIGKLYKSMGLLPTGQLIEADKSSLVAGYMGQTAIKTQEVIQSAMGGVLFIDEAYSLTEDEKDSFGREAIETVLKAMEDHRDQLVVIVAGYTELMHKFIESNPGLSSRFSKYFEFPDYTPDELYRIFLRFCHSNGYKLNAGSETAIKTRFAAMYDARDEHFGNARDARNLFEKIISCQADRLASSEQLSDKELETITKEDVEKAIKE